MAKTKGEAGVADARAFIQAFPFEETERIITIEQFDEWAETCGYYTAETEHYLKLDQRNKLRQKVNGAAASEAWVAQEGADRCFHIAVHVHGKSYKIQHPEDALSQKATRLPAQVKSFAGTKRKAIKALRSSLDLNELDDEMRFRIRQLDREVDRFLRGIDYQNAEMEREFKAIGYQIQQMVDKKMIEPKNGGIRAFLEVASKDDPELDFHVPDEDEAETQGKAE